MFLVNSRFSLVSAAISALTPQAPLLPKLRGHFAEFLNHDSLDLLGILYLTTCVGFGYGQLKPHVDAFLGSIGSPTTPKQVPHQISGTQATDLPITHPTSLPGYNHSPGLATFLRHTHATLPGSDHAQTHQHEPKARENKLTRLASPDQI